MYGAGVVLDEAGDVIAEWPVPSVDPDEALLRSASVVQPSVFVRAIAFARVGALDESARWVFDFEFFIRLLRDGPWARTSTSLSGWRGKTNR